MGTTTAERFRSAYSKPIRIHTATGNGMQDEYGYELNKKGIKELVKTGEKNLYAEIQSYAEEVKIENILKRAAIGDMTDFRPDGIYQDISEIPTNLNEAKAEMMKIEKIWNNMDTETKAKYDWSLENFISEAGKESWLYDTGLLEKPVEKKEEPADAEQPENEGKEE